MADQIVEKLYVNDVYVPQYYTFSVMDITQKVERNRSSINSGSNSEIIGPLYVLIIIAYEGHWLGDRNSTKYKYSYCSLYTNNKMLNGN